MSWNDYGAALIAAVVTRAGAAGIALQGEVTQGEPAYPCQDTIVAAWIEGIDSTTPEPNCVYTPRVRWRVRLHHCHDVEDNAELATAWHAAFEAVWCAIAAHLLTYCENCPTRIESVTVNTPSGGTITADYVITTEEGCANAEQEN